MTRVVIIGGGIVGCSTAYYLRKLYPKESTKELDLVIVDEVGIAKAASGSAGGFLASDWHTPPILPLAMHSFDLHKKLAKSFGASKIGYRSCRASEPTCKPQKIANKEKSNFWFDGCDPAGCPSLATDK
eukprot:g1999.t1